MEPTELRVDMEDFENEHRYAKYGQFSVGPENDKFRLKVGDFVGNAGNNVSYLVQYDMISPFYRGKRIHLSTRFSTIIFSWVEILNSFLL